MPSPGPRPGAVSPTARSSRWPSATAARLGRAPARAGSPPGRGRWHRPGRRCRLRSRSRGSRPCRAGRGRTLEQQSQEERRGSGHAGRDGRHPFARPDLEERADDGDPGIERTAPETVPLDCRLHPGPQPLPEPVEPLVGVGRQLAQRRQPGRRRHRVPVERAAVADRAGRRASKSSMTSTPPPKAASG